MLSKRAATFISWVDCDDQLQAFPLVPSKWSLLFNFLRKPFEVFDELWKTVLSF